MKHAALMKLTAAAGALALGACTSMYGDTDSSDGMQASASASTDVAYVGGAAMYPTKTIVENAIASPIHTTLVTAVKAAGLVETLNSPGPFTVFAPTDQAFAAVPENVRSFLLMPANKQTLSKVLTYHVVPGRVTASDLVAKINAGGGKTMVTTVAGEDLTFQMKDGKVMIMGKGGSSAYVSQADVMQSNGVIHVVDGVLTPSM